MKGLITLAASAACLVGCSIDPMNCPSSVSSAEPFAEALEAFAGRNAEDCGLVPVAVDPSSAVACAKEMQKDKKPFRVAVELKGVDSYVWNGMAANERGELAYAFFDSDVRGSICNNPKLTVDKCTAVSLPTGSAREFKCSST